MAATMLGSLLVSLGLESAQFHSGLNKAERHAKTSGDRMEALGRKVGTATKAMIGLGTAIAGSQLVGQLKDMALAGLEHASSLGEQAQQLGVTTSELQRYRYIATQVGIDQAVMDKGLAKLSVTLGKLGAGAAAPTKALERLGLSQQDIARVSKMTAGEAIPFLADAFQKLKSPTEAAAIAADLFGAKMGGKFLTLLMNGKAGIDQLTESYKKLGIEITEGQIAKADEAADKLAAIQQVTAAKQAQIAADNAEGLIAGLAAWENFKVGMLSVFGQLSAGSAKLDAEMKRIGDSIPDPIETIGRAIDWLDETYARARQGIIDSAKRIGTSLAALANDGIAAAMRFYQGVKSWIIDKLNAAWDMAMRKIEQVKKAFYDLYDAVVGNSYVPDMVDGIADHMKRLDTVMVKQAEKATSKTAAAFRKLAEEVMPILDRLFPENARRNAFNADFAKIEAAGKGGALSPAATRAALDALQDEFRANAPELPVPEIVLKFENADTVIHSIEGIGAAFDELSLRIKPTQSRMEQFFNSIDTSSREVFEGMSQELSRVILGFQSLGDAIRNIVARLADQALNALFKIGFAAIGIPGFAGGTNFAPRGLALVGERGPELVRFRGGEQVIPNHELGQFGGRQEVHKPTFVFPGVTNERMAREAAGQAARRYRQEINGPLRRM